MNNKGLEKNRLKKDRKIGQNILDGGTAFSFLIFVLGFILAIFNKGQSKAIADFLDLSQREIYTLSTTIVISGFYLIARLIHPFLLEEITQVKKHWKRIFALIALIVVFFFVSGTGVTTIIETKIIPVATQAPTKISSEPPSITPTPTATPTLTPTPQYPPAAITMKQYYDAINQANEADLRDLWEFQKDIGQSKIGLYVDFWKYLIVKYRIYGCPNQTLDIHLSYYNREFEDFSKPVDEKGDWVRYKLGISEGAWEIIEGDASITSPGANCELVFSN